MLPSCWVFTPGGSGPGRGRRMVEFFQVLIFIFLLFCVVFVWDVRPREVKTDRGEVKKRGTKKEKRVGSLV